MKQSRQKIQPFEHSKQKSTSRKLIPQTDKITYPHKKQHNLNLTKQPKEEKRKDLFFLKKKTSGQRTFSSAFALIPQGTCQLPPTTGTR